MISDCDVAIGLRTWAREEEVVVVFDIGVVGGAVVVVRVVVGVAVVVVAVAARGEGSFLLALGLIALVSDTRGGRRRRLY